MTAYPRRGRYRLHRRRAGARGRGVEAVARAFYEAETGRICWSREPASVRRRYRQDARVAVAELDDLPPPLWSTALH